MSTWPYRRYVALLGVLLLLPTAWLLATGAITAADAGIRAALTLVAVKVIDRVGRWGFRRAVITAGKIHGTEEQARQRS